LIEFNLSNATGGEASFYEAKFMRGAGFRNTTFTRVVNFAIASFDWPGCDFSRAKFIDDVYFGDTLFTAGHADFENAHFHGDVRLVELKFFQKASALQEP
jgi:hypothetical protein